MALHPNHMIQDAHRGASSLARQEMPLDAAMWAHAVAHALSPLARAVEAERAKLLRRHGVERDGAIEVRPGDPGWAAYAEGYGALMMAEQEVPALPPPIALSALGSEEERRSLRVQGVQITALRELGVLRVEG